MSRLAFLTAGILVGPEDDPRIAGFLARVDENFSAAAAHPGCLAIIDDDPVNPWRTVHRPPLYADPSFSGRLAVTLSVWKDLASVYVFAYRGVHAEALRRRHAWFVPAQWPTYVAWWVADDHLPTLDEAYGRQALLHQEGPTPAAFDFKQPFDAQGHPFRLDRASLRSELKPHAGSRTGDA